jgi:hypothetical protein
VELELEGFLPLDWWSELPTSDTPTATVDLEPAFEPTALALPVVRTARRDRGASSRLRLQSSSLSLAVMPQGWHRVPVFRSEGGSLVVLETHAERYSLRRAGVCVPCCLGTSMRRVFRTRFFAGSAIGFRPQGDWRVTTQRELEQVDRDYGRCFSVLAVRTPWVATVEAFERWLRLPSTLAAEQDARERCPHCSPR